MNELTLKTTEMFGEVQNVKSEEFSSTHRLLVDGKYRNVRIFKENGRGDTIEAE